jgi:ABC-type antimicrobial peptide transport system permease subunit
VIASVGIYAVMAQAAGSRTREIGVRMALGATPRKIAALVLRRGLWQLISGLGLGIAVALPATAALGGLPLLDAPSDPLLMAAIAALLLTVGLFACWLPARRAAALNPVAAIRNE